MFVGYSEIIVHVIVEHVQFGCKLLGFLSTWGELLSFSVPVGTEKIAELWFARECC